jgi:hypothetical protein
VTPNNTNVAIANTRVSRTRIGTAQPDGAQAVADAAHRLDVGAAERTVDLSAQVGDVLVHDVRESVVREVPDVVEHLGAGDDVTRVAHQQIEQGRLLGCQVQLGRAPPRTPRGGVEAEIPDRQHRWPVRAPPPDERAQSRTELAEAERLRQVVVGADVEPVDAIGDRVAGGEQQDRRPSIGCAEPAADLEAVDARQHHVEHDRVVVVLGPEPEAVGSVARYVDGVAVLAQATLEQGGHPRFVLDDEHAHQPRCYVRFGVIRV